MRNADNRFVHKLRDNFPSRLKFLSFGGGAIALLAACSGGQGSDVISDVASPRASTAIPAPLPGATSTASDPEVATTVDVAVQISRSSTSGQLPEMLPGLSYEKSVFSSSSFFSETNPSLVNCFRLLVPSILRIGGNSVDTTTWMPNGAGATYGQAAPSDINRLAQFLRATGWKVIYGINMAKNTVANAAAEAAYAAATLGTSLYGFEIGNECDQYVARGLRQSPYTADDFVNEWSTFANAIRKVAPFAPLTGPASGGNVSTWTVPFANRAGSGISLLTQHYYRGNGQSAASTIQNLLTSDPGLPSELQRLHDAADSNKVALGYRLAECNSYYNGGTLGVSDAYGTALWAIDFMMINALNNAAGINFHGGGDSPGYTPIAEANDVVVDLRPVYYGMLLVSQISPGPLCSVQVATTLLFSAYAVEGGDGTLYVVLINKDPSNNGLATLTLPTNATNAQPLVLAGTGLMSTAGTTLGGAIVSPNGSWTPKKATPIPVQASKLSLTVPPASAVLLSVR